MTRTVCAQEIFHNFEVSHEHGDINYANGDWYTTPMMNHYKSKLCGQYNRCNDWIACETTNGRKDTQWTDCAENKAKQTLS